MKNKISFIILLLLPFVVSAKEKNCPYLTEETCAFAPEGNSYLDEVYQNGGTAFFNNAGTKAHVEEQLNQFNAENNCALHVYCGRYFLSYEQTWNWDTSMYSMMSPALRKAYSNYNQKFPGTHNSQSVIEQYYSEYKQFVERTDGKPAMLIVYLQCQYYDLQDTTRKLLQFNVTGLISTGFSGTDKLRIEYLKTRGSDSIKLFEDPGVKIDRFVTMIRNEFATPITIENANCPDCPLHPDLNQSYWDDAGRLWRWQQGEDHHLKWMDLSFEFPEEGQGYDLSWKTEDNVAVQAYHIQLYTDKLIYLRSDPLQHSLGGVPPELEKQLWRVTQFAAVNTIKERYVNKHISMWENFIPVWGNARHSYYDFAVANGSINYQFAGSIGIVMAATDILLCDAFIQNGCVGVLRSPVNFIQKGIQFTTSAGRSIVLYGKNSVVKLSLVLSLERAPQTSVDFFTNRNLPNALELFESSTGKYLKYDRDNGRALVGTFEDKLDGSCAINFEKEVTVPNEVNLSEQVMGERVLVKVEEAIENTLGNFISETGISANIVSDETLLNQVKSWQGHGDYIGVDEWFTVEIPSGTVVYGGIPGQTEFYSFENVLNASNFDKTTFWQSIQVKENLTYGYRTQLGKYITNKTIHVAVSKATANSQYGAGGAWQIFISDFGSDLTYFQTVTLH